MNKFTQSEDYRRDELIRIIEHSVEKLTLAELEALYYDMTTKSYINDWLPFGKLIVRHQTADRWYRNRWSRASKCYAA